MKPMIKRIGRVYERDDGMTVLDGWVFDTSNLPARIFETPEEILLAFLGLMESDLPEDELWTVDELREVAEQEAVLSLLPTVGEGDGSSDHSTPAAA